MATTVCELFLIPIRLASLEAEERRGAEHTLCSSHISPFVPALAMEKAAEFICKKLKEEGGQTERGVGILLPPHMRSLFTSEEKPNSLFAQFPPLLFFKELYF